MSPTFPFTARDGRAGRVRPARASDARACLAIVAEAAAERPRTLAVLEEELWSPRVWRRHRLPWGERGVSLVAELGGAVVGQLVVERGSRRVTLHSAGFGVTVAARARGLGVGRALLDAVDEWAGAHGVRRLELAVFPGNDRAINLYRSAGYEQEGIERSGIAFPEGAIDVIKMSKLLEEPPGTARRPPR